MAKGFPRFGFCGFGEAASTFAGDLRKKWPDIRLLAYDKNQGDTIRNRAVESAVTLLSFPSALADQATVILSMVTASTAFEAAQEFAEILNPKHIYVDFNSVSPKLKKEIGDALKRRKISTVDSAVMGSIPENGLRVAILLAGDKAPYVSKGMNTAGFNTEVVGLKMGDAEAIKRVRSIFTKGLEGLFVEMLLAAKRYGVEEKVIDAVSQSLENKRLRDVMNTLVVSQAKHSGRKKNEMDNVIEALQDEGLEPTMSRATRGVFA